jgi:hypothetical protein
MFCYWGYLQYKLLKMKKTEEQELSDQISRLYAELKTYKKAIADPSSRIDKKNIADTISLLEAEINLLEAELETQLLILRLFDFLSQPLLFF